MYGITCSDRFSFLPVFARGRSGILGLNSTVIRPDQKSYTRDFKEKFANRNLCSLEVGRNFWLRSNLMFIF